MNAPLPLTEFPSLLHTRSGADEQRLTWTEPAIERSKQDLIVAWGSLLRKYTAESAASFIVVDQDVAYVVNVNSDLDDPNHYSQDTLNDDELGLRGTLLSFSQKYAVKVSLCICFGVEEVILSHSSRLFSSEFAVHLLSQFRSILDSRKPSAKSPHSVLNFPSQILPGPSCLHHFLKPSEKTALEFLDADWSKVSLSYNDLLGLSGSLAVIIENNGICSGDIVPLMIPESPELYISLLAILRVGACFCPISADRIASERIKFICKDISAKAVITTKELAPLFKDSNLHIIIAEISLLKYYSFEDRPVDPDGLAYCMYDLSFLADSIR